VIATEADAAAKAEAASWKEAERALARMEKEKTNEVKRATKERVAAEKAAIKETEAAAKTALKQRKADEEAFAQAAIAASKAHARQVEADYARMAKAAKGAGRGALSIAGAGIGFAGSIARDMAMGAGVDLSAAGHFGNAARLQTLATNLSNQGYMENDARNGQRVDPKVLQAQLMSVGSATGYSGNDVGEALSAFVSKTGDLKTGREVIQQIGMVSRATGADVRDMADAAGDLSNAFADGPNKAKQIGEALRVMAGQGKVGAVEIKDLATEMAKISAAAGQFEGDTSKNLANFGALAQLARRGGGATSATMAATSVSAFADTFSKGARLDAFASKGISVAGAGGKIRNVEDIIVDSLSATRGNSRAMGELFASTQARRAVRGSELTYRNAFAQASGSDDERNKAALAAVREEFERLRDSTMSGTELMDSFTAAMSTSEVQAQLVNNELDKLAGTTADAMAPAFLALVPVLREQLIPALSDAAVATAKWIAWFATTNEQNTAKTEQGIDRASKAYDADKKQLQSHKVTQAQYDASLQAEKDLQAAADRQGEDKEWSKTAVGRALIGIKGEAVGLSGAASAFDWSHPLDSLGAMKGIRRESSQRAIDAEAQKDSASDRSNAEATRAIDALHATNKAMLRELEKLNKAQGAVPAGGPSKIVPGDKDTTR
jgi:hypothetical protein